MRLLLFSLFLVSVSVLSAPLEKGEMGETGVVRPERQEGPAIPMDCCIPRYTPCTLQQITLECDENEWPLNMDVEGCFINFQWYYCCGRCECTNENGTCHISNKPTTRYVPMRPDDMWWDY